MSKKYFCITMFLIMFFKISAQSLPIRNYSSQDGLSQNQVLTITQDSQGFIWFKTQAGLSKFDGYHFKNITMNEGLPSNVIRSFFEKNDKLFLLGYDFVSVVKDDQVIKNYDKHYFINRFNDTIINTTTYSDSLYNIIYGFSRKAVYSLNTQEEDFRKVFYNQLIPEEIMNNTVFSMLEESLLYIDMNNDSYLIDFSTSKVIPILSQLGLERNLTVNSQIITLDSEKDHNILIYNNRQSGVSKFFIFNSKDNEFTKILESKNLFFMYERHDSFVTIARNSNDEYLVLNENGNVIALNMDEMKYIVTDIIVKSEFTDLTQINDAYITDNKIWVLTNSGLLEYDLNQNITNYYSIKNGLSSLNLQSMYIDRESNIWIGTNGSGVDMIVNSNVTNFTEKNGLSHSGTTNTLLGDDGSLWVSTDNGLTRMFPDGKIKHYLVDSGLRHQDVWALNKDHQGNILVGTLNSGIHRYQNGRFIDIRPKEIPPNTAYVTEIFIDSSLNIWVPVFYGMLKFDKDYNYSYFPFERSTIYYTIIEDSSGLLWKAGTKKTIDIFNKDGEIVKEILFDFNVFSANIVRLYFRNEKTLWLLTYGEGLIEYCLETEKFNKIFTDEFRDAEILKALTEDKLGNVWIGTINGIYRISPNNVVTRFSEEDGLIGNDIRTSGAYCDDNGILWFNSTFGLIRINPYEEYLDENPPLIHITDFYMDKRIDLSNDKLVFKYNNNSALFRYVGLEFRNPNRILYQYYLVGFDNNWSDFTTERYVRYTNLNPGMYKFMVRAKDNAGNLSEINTLNFQILPPFWKTLWFRLMIIILSAFLVYLFIKWRVKALERKNQELETEVALRTKELQEKNDQIISSIRYAKRIQSAILPQESFLKEHFSETFVIYRPRDIIAGDYYWFSEVHGYTFLAVADCTGHGVPGALLSIVGNMLLNEIINKYEIYDPAKILELLHENVRSVLCQNDENSHSNDGMEVCLCRFNSDYTELAYAGANRPLYLVRNHKLEQINGNKKGIGGKQREEKRIFDSKILKLENNDMIYLSTDGFVDQANKDDKKFGSRRLKHLLQYIADKKTSEQLKILLDNFDTHSENEAQRDDVTLIGVRIDLKGRQDI